MGERWTGHSGAARLLECPSYFGMMPDSSQTRSKLGAAGRDRMEIRLCAGRPTLSQREAIPRQLRSRLGASRRGRMRTYCKLQHVGREAWGQLACVARALVRWPGRSQQRVGGLDGYFGGGDMGSFRGVCTSQQQQMRRTDFELATLCTPMRTMLAYFRMIVLWGSLWGVCGEFRMTVLWGQQEEGPLVAPLSSSFCPPNCN